VKDQIEHSDVKTIVMLDCGGIVFLEELLPDLPDGVEVFVIDSHRPIHYTFRISDQVRLTTSSYT
jgi:CDC45-like protein